MIDRNCKLSAHFYLRELLRSEQAARSGRPIEADDYIVAQLKRLCVDLLEPIRDYFGGRSLTITSGYRPPWLNRLIGGSTTSEHPDGRAADFVIAGHTPAQVCRGVLTLLPTLPINQLILEFDEWTHVSIVAMDQRPKREALTARHQGGRTVYLAGIET